MVNNSIKSICVVVLACACSGLAAAPVTVFTTDFDGQMPANIAPGTAFLTGVQGFAGLGVNPFNVNMLRSATGNVVTLTVSNLPPHNSLSLAFLFAAIDSLDGTGTFPQGDFFNVVVDGVTVFNESFANAIATQIQSYVPPPGVELARRIDLGFGPGAFHNDSAYDLGADPVFANIAHSANSVTVEFFIAGAGIQSIDDESWGMDNLSVTVNVVNDADGDGIPDNVDNCTLIANSNQRDADGDGIGSLCDPDIAPSVNDCIVNFLDLNAMRSAFFTNNAIADLDGSGLVNFADLAIMRDRFFLAPGPSGNPARLCP